jgi:hypothetical protein
MAKRWQYLAASVPEDLDSTLGYLKTLGEDGWELIQICDVGPDGKHRIWLKREIGPEGRR